MGEKRPPIRVQTEHGIEVTEGVQTAYDLVLGSLDWGSGFFTVEDVEPLIRLAVALGYDTTPLRDYLTPPSYNWHPGEEREREHAKASAKAQAQIDAIRKEVLGDA